MAGKPARACCSRWFLGASLVALLAACGGRSHETREGFLTGGSHPSPDDVTIATGGAAAGASTSGGESIGGSESTGGSATSNGGATAAGAATGGSAEQGGAALAGAGGESSECDGKPYGALAAAQTAGDCNKTICDGAGTLLEVIDPTDLPSAPEGCTIPLCTNAGPSSVPSPAGSACESAAGAGVCDGHGSCFECLSNEDCSPGDVCGSHVCQNAGNCGNNMQDGQETAVDCGGPDCGACNDGRPCAIDQDCKSDLCDEVYHTCLPNSCRDGKQDNDETDVDCGGTTCAGCYVLEKCLLDRDCATQKCNTDKGTCGGSGCNDKRQDGFETDVDCGGLECLSCGEGQKCHYGSDCQTGICSHGVGAPRCF